VDAAQGPLSPVDVRNEPGVEFQVLQRGVGGDDDLPEEGFVDPQRPVDEALAPDLDESLVDAAQAACPAAGQDDTRHEKVPECLSAKVSE
jgi:hypothetical protein